MIVLHHGSGLPKGAIYEAEMAKHGRIRKTCAYWHEPKHTNCAWCVKEKKLAKKG